MISIPSSEKVVLGCHPVPLPPLNIKFRLVDPGVASFYTVLRAGPASNERLLRLALATPRLCCPAGVS